MIFCLAEARPTLPCKCPLAAVFPSRVEHWQSTLFVSMLTGCLQWMTLVQVSLVLVVLQAWPVVRWAGTLVRMILLYIPMMMMAMNATFLKCLWILTSMAVPVFVKISTLFAGWASGQYLDTTGGHRGLQFGSTESERYHRSHLCSRSQGWGVGMPVHR